MTSLQLRLTALSLQGLIDANKGNPFYSKADAMRFINECRRAV